MHKLLDSPLTPKVIVGFNVVVITLLVVVNVGRTVI